MVKTYRLNKQGEKNITTNFKVKEFACPTSNIVRIDRKVVKILQCARNLINSAINITSGYRTPVYNEYVGGVKNSYHIQGIACDTYSNKVNASTLAKIYQLRGANGIGLYIDTKFVHVDIRPYKSFWINNNGVTLVDSFLTKSEIKEIQTILFEHYLYNYEIDGIIGAKTIKAFRLACNSKKDLPVKEEILKVLRR